MEKKLAKTLLFQLRKFLVLVCSFFQFHIKNLGKKRLPNAPKRILVCNPAHIGDVILATSILPLLKDHFPKVEIGFLCGSWSSKVVEGHPHVDFVHHFDDKKFNRSDANCKEKKARHRASFTQAVGEIRTLKYDIAIDLYPHPSCTHLASVAKVLYRIGYARKWGGLFVTHPVLWRHKDQPVISFHLDLLEKLNIPRKQAWPNLPIKKSSPLFPPHGILFHIGTGAPQREWPVEKWKELSKVCVEAGYHLIFTGQGMRESKQLEEITKDLAGFTNYCNKLDFEEWVSLVSKAPLVVNVNTSAGHVASCFQKNNIVIFCGIDKQIEWGPANPNATLLMKKVPCAPCFRGCAAMTCIREVTVAEVFAEIKKKMKSAREMPSKTTTEMKRL